jgi:AMP phosphorylase
LYSGGCDIAVLGEDLANDLDLHPLDRVLVRNPDDQSKTVIAQLTFSYETDQVISLFSDTFDKLEIKPGDIVSVFPTTKPGSLNHIIDKINRQELNKDQITEIVKDIVDDKLTDLEMASFITSICMGGSTIDEIFYLTKALAETGDMLRFDSEIVADKHCSGSVPGNRTTPIVVSVIAAVGITIPKSSSRAITSAAGTADVMEVLCKVDFTKEQIQEIVNKTNGCIIWGGGLEIAPGDAKLIKVRRPLKADPEGLLIPSIIAKKYAMGATHVIFDIPLGMETRYNNIGEARLLERMMIQIASQLGMKATVYITDGDEPIGDGIGPVLEAIDVIKVLQNHQDAPLDLREKAIMVGGKLLDLIGIDSLRFKGTGFELMTETIDNGKGYKKFQHIIEAQGGDPDITIDELKERLSPHFFEVFAETSGMIYDIRNPVVAKLARMAGAPQNPGCGIYFHHKFADIISSGDLLATVYCGSTDKIRRAKRVLDADKMVYIK